MVLVPPYVEVDGLVVPLRVHPVDARGPAAIGVQSDPARPFLEPLIYVVADLLGQNPAETVERIAMKRLGTARDIANSVVFFASELAGFVNGQVLAVDGGK